MTDFKVGDRIAYETNYERITGTVLAIHGDWIWLNDDDPVDDDPLTVDVVTVHVKHCTLIPDTVTIEVSRASAENYVAGSYKDSSLYEAEGEIYEAFCKALEADRDS